MKYCAISDIVTGYGGETFALLAGDGYEPPDLDKVREAIAYAEATIDSYIGDRYVLPLPGIVSEDDPTQNVVPPKLKFCAVDLAVYRLAHEHDKLSTEKKCRYEDSMAWLEKVRDRQAGLGIADRPNSLADVIRDGPARQLQRCHTGGLV